MSHFKKVIKVAKDALIAAARDAHWITVKPNGPDHKGEAVQISEGGVVLKGMGGKFTGKHISQAKSGAGVKKGHEVAVSAPSAPKSPAKPEPSKKTGPALKPGHLAIQEHRKVLKTTEKGIGISNKVYERAKALHAEGGEAAVREKGSAATRAAWANKEDIRWLPKSGVSVENGHVVGVEPWVAEKHGFPVNGNPKGERQYLNVPYDQREKAKAAGAKWDAEKKKWYHPSSGSLPDSLKSFSAQAAPQAKAAPTPVSPLPQAAAKPQKKVSEMTSVAEVEERIATLKKKRENYQRVANEGGDGPNPFDSHLREAVARRHELKGDKPHPPMQHWAYSEEAVKRALRGEDSAMSWAEDGRDDIENYEDAMTLDKSTYTVQQIGKRQALTPEGFLLCEAVPIARTGEMYYGPGEVPVEAGSDGIIRISREADEVFSADTIASYNGKPVTNDHPDDGVTPENWKRLTVGVVQNVRRGTGIEDDLLFADLLITDAEGIKSVQDGKREVSCGYDAEYEQVSPGRGVQRRIIGNHVALVEQGRCGPRCAIGDSAMAKHSGLVDRLMAAFRSKDEAAFKKTLDEAELPEEESEEEKEKREAKEKADKTADAIGAIAATLKTIDARLAAVEKTKDEAHEEPDGDKGKTEDEDEDQPGDPDGKKTADSLKEILSRAEILSPGIKLSMPTADALADPKKSRDALCNCKRKALDAAMQTEDGKKAVLPFLGGKTTDKASCATVDAAFIGASELIAATRNAGIGRVMNSINTKDAGRKAPATDVDSLNKANREFWAKRGGAPV